MGQCAQAAAAGPIGLAQLGWLEQSVAGKRGSRRHAAGRTCARRRCRGAARLQRQHCCATALTLPSRASQCAQGAPGVVRAPAIALGPGPSPQLVCVACWCAGVHTGAQAAVRSPWRAELEGRASDPLWIAVHTSAASGDDCKLCRRLQGGRDALPPSKAILQSWRRAAGDHVGFSGLWRTQLRVLRVLCDRWSVTGLHKRLLGPGARLPGLGLLGAPSAV